MISYESSAGPRCSTIYIRASLDDSCWPAGPNSENHLESEAGFRRAAKSDDRGRDILYGDAGAVEDHDPVRIVRS